jgi:hypothetical protein
MPLDQQRAVRMAISDLSTSEKHDGVATDYIAVHVLAHPHDLSLVLLEIADSRH